MNPDESVVVCPSGLVTITAAVPELLEGVTQLISLSLTKLTLVQATPPTVTEIPETKPPPLTVIVVPPERGPPMGSMEEMESPVLTCSGLSPPIHPDRKISKKLRQMVKFNEPRLFGFVAVIVLAFVSSTDASSSRLHRYRLRFQVYCSI